MAVVNRAKTPSALIGALLAVIGLAAGVSLVMQPQLLNQKAATTTYSCPAGVSGYVCNDCNGVPFCNRDTTITCTDWRNLNCTGGQCTNDPHCFCGGCPSGKWCDSGTRSCLSTGGTGNCSNNTGDCWVITPIGVGPDGRVCAAGGHWTTCEAGYTCNGTLHDCVPLRTPTSTPRTPPPPTRTPTPTPTPTRTATPTPVAQCSTVKIYTPAWSPVTPTMFSTYRAGNQVYFCVNGTTNSTVGSFTKARFRINGTLRAETTLKKPNTMEFCDLYTIPTNVYSFRVEGEIYHTVLGWK